MHERGKEARAVLAVIVSGCVGYTKKPRPEAGMIGIGKAPQDADEEERYAVKCFLEEAHPRNAGDAVARGEAEP